MSKHILQVGNSNIKLNIDAAKVLLSSDQIKGIWDLVHMRDSTP